MLHEVIDSSRSFGDFIKAQGYHGLYIVTVAHESDDGPSKIGIAANPRRRICDIQCANFIELGLWMFWWLPSRDVARSVEDAFKRKQMPKNIRGEWFDMSPEEMRDLVLAEMDGRGIWYASDEILRRLKAEESENIADALFGQARSLTRSSFDRIG